MWWLLFCSVSLFSMERQPTEIHNSPFGISSVCTDESEQDSLCDVALGSIYRNRLSSIDHQIRPKIKQRLRSSDDSRVWVLRQMKSGEDVRQEEYDVIRDMIEEITIEVMQDAQRKSDSKYNKKQVGGIAALFTVITSLIAIVIDSTTCKK